MIDSIEQKSASHGISLKSQNVRTFTFVLIVIQSIGIRFFSGQGTFLAIVIILLSWKGFSFLKKKDITTLALIIMFLCINSIVNPTFELSSLLFQISLVISTYIFLLQYQSVQLLEDDFYRCLKFIFYHASVGYVLYVLIAQIFSQVDFAGLSYYNLFYVFYVSAKDYGSLARNVGLCWEPGVLQLVLNLFLFLSIKRKKSIFFLCLIGLGILSTFSTAGYIIVVLNIVYFIILQIRNKASAPIIILVSLICLSGFFALIKGNASDKFDSSNTSGLVRLRDFYIGVELITEKPLLGHGIFDAKYLESKVSVSGIESGLFTRGYLNENGDFSGGYTDGLLGLACWYGLPAAIYIYILTFRNKFAGVWYERIILFLILALTCISEPITYTSIFLLFSFTCFIFKETKTLKKEPA